MNSLLIRIESLSDHKSATLNIIELCTELYRQANRGADPASLELREMSLTGNMLLSELKARKIMWTDA